MEWTEENQRQAWAEGWDVFTINTGILQIQALDDPAATCEEAGIQSTKIFNADCPCRDWVATAHVYTRAALGHKHCIDAIELIESKFEALRAKAAELDKALYLERTKGCAQTIEY